MDYNALYAIWKREKETEELQPLDKRFYIELNEYVKDLKGDIQLLDEKTLMARLAQEESENVKTIVTDLILTRYRKVSKAVFEEKSISPDCLTQEENVIYNSILSTMDEVKSIIQSVLRGRVPHFKEVKVGEKSKSILIRFLQAIPAIIGPNMRTYGPFNVDDIASLPIENGESLIKKGVAVKVEVR
jgi:DNA replication factor GINS